MSDLLNSLKEQGAGLVEQAKTFVEENGAELVEQAKTLAEEKGGELVDKAKEAANGLLDNFGK